MCAQWSATSLADFFVSIWQGKQSDRVASLAPDSKRRPTYRKRRWQLELMAVYFGTVDFEMGCFVAR